MKFINIIIIFFSQLTLYVCTYTHIIVCITLNCFCREILVVVVHENRLLGSLFLLIYHKKHAVKSSKLITLASAIFVVAYVNAGIILRCTMYI